MSILSGLTWPLRKLDQETSEIVAEKVQVGITTALTEVPILAALLRGEEVNLKIKLEVK